MTQYQIKWVLITPVSNKPFNHKYYSALSKSGFVQIAPDLFGSWYNSDNQESIERMNNNLRKLNAKIASYKRKKNVLSFTITDKQFGLIGSTKVDWAKAKVPTTLGYVPVTYNQMYESGCIPLPGSQARFNHPNQILFK